MSNKIVSTDKLNKLAKALDNRLNITAEELTELIDDVRNMLGGRSLIYLSQNEFDALSEEDKNDPAKSYIITDAEDLSHEHVNKDFLDSLEEGNIDASSINGHDVWVGTEDELNLIANKDPNTIYFKIDIKTEVVQVNVVDGILRLTTDRYQKTNMINGTQIVFPSVTDFTEIHLYFNSDSDLDIILPDCKWRAEPNIESGKSYEIIAIYNTIEWIVNCIVYS